jgi:hypothetical protein
MLNHNQDGASSVGLSLVISIVLLVAAIGFGAWAYSGRQDYKNKVDSKISVAVQQEKSPYSTYDGPEAYGSIVLQYPRTWSGYVDTSGSDYPVDGYFNPGVVPSITSQSSVFALQVRVLNQSYSQTLQSLQQNGVTSQAYALPSLPKIVGVELSGPIASNQTNETMVVLPIRADTIEISTDGTQYLNDFNNTILKYFSFSP